MDLQGLPHVMKGEHVSTELPQAVTSWTVRMLMKKRINTPLPPLFPLFNNNHDCIFLLLLMHAAVLWIHVVQILNKPAMGPYYTSVFLQFYIETQIIFIFFINIYLLI